MGSRRAQQEMVGFVLIVVLVVVGLMVFLVISLRSSVDSQGSQSDEVSHMVGALLGYSTSCAADFVPNYGSVQDLVRACYAGRSCVNLGVSACEYLEGEVSSALVRMLATTPYESFDFSILESDNSGVSGLLRLGNNSCSRGSIGAQRTISQGSTNLLVRLSVC